MAAPEPQRQQDPAATTAPVSGPQPQPTPLPTPILTLPGCLIRAYHSSDAAQMAAAANTPSVTRWMRNTFPHPYSLDHAKSWIALSTSASPTLNFGIYSLDSNEFLGSIGLIPGTDIQCRTYEVGYWIAPVAWGRGLATEALREFVRWTFETFGEVLRLEAAVFQGNEASCRVLGKAGFVHEGTRRRAVWKNGEVLDQLLWGLLREECLGEGR